MEENQNQNENNQEIVKVEKDNTTIETVNTVKISNEAVATYVGIAIVEVSGVYGMSGTLAGITEAISGKKSYTRGVKVEVTDKTAKIDVSIVVEYGARIPDVAFEIQNRVKKAVETMSGLKVSEVNVHVQGVNTEFEKSKEEPSAEVQE